MAALGGLFGDLLYYLFFYRKSINRCVLAPPSKYF